MQKFTNSIKTRLKFPSLEELVFIVRRMSLRGKTLFLALTILFTVSFLTILWQLSDAYMVEAPSYGGSLTEGIIGTPRFINPVFAISDADRDMISLTYSGLLRSDNQGHLIKDMAEKYDISPDGLVYTFTLKAGLLWQDGKPITSEDIIYTVELVKNPVSKSPKRAGWEGVEPSKIDDRTLKFTLKKPYAPFLENTTIGIIPKHIWEGISPDQMASSEMNIRPIGSGPYKITNIKRNSIGVISSYEMKSNKDFALAMPYIKKITLKFYPSEKELLAAYQKKEIESASAITPAMLEKIETGDNARSLNLPRVFGVFFNQNNNKALAKKEARQALNMAVDRKKIIDAVLKGYGAEIFGPFPPDIDGAIAKTDTDGFFPDKAMKLLEDNGWKMNDSKKIMEKKSGKEVLPLEFSISTSDSPELKQAAQMLKSMWKQIGAEADVKVFEIGDLNQLIIRPRKYDALLFGEIVGNNPDPFAFWHSSQRNDPGLNIALYANIKTDKLLEESRVAQEESVRRQKNEEFQREIAKDIPAVFLFSPKFIYILPDGLKGANEMKSIATPSERFSTIYKWHKETNKVWKIFANY